MSPWKFEYHAPEKMEEALKLLKEQGQGGGAVVMAGGTDLLLKMRGDQLGAKVVIDIKKIETLAGIRLEPGKGLTLGAATSIAEIAEHPGIREHYPAVVEAALATANVQIRNMGTVGGNICNASPCADNATVLLAMGAEVTLDSLDGERKVPLNKFFKGPGLTAIKEGEILTSIFVPMPAPGTGSSYTSFSARGKVDMTGIGVGAMLTIQDGRCAEVRIALASVAPTPMRAMQAEKTLKGKRISGELLDKAGREASRECNPITDIRATAEYRRHLVAVLTTRVLEASNRRASK